MLGQIYEISLNRDVAYNLDMLKYLIAAENLVGGNLKVENITLRTAVKTAKHVIKRNVEGKLLIDTPRGLLNACKLLRSVDQPYAYEYVRAELAQRLLMFNNFNVNKTVEELGMDYEFMLANETGGVGWVFGIYDGEDMYPDIVKIGYGKWFLYLGVKKYGYMIEARDDLKLVGFSTLGHLAIFTHNGTNIPVFLGGKGKDSHCSVMCAAEIYEGTFQQCKKALLMR